VHLPDEKVLVSRQHARIMRDQDGYWLVNLSANKTLLNGRAFDGPTPLRQGDRISILDFELIFEDDPDPTPPEPRYRAVADGGANDATPELTGAAATAVINFGLAVGRASLCRADLLEKVGPLLASVFPAAQTVGVMLRLADARRGLRLESCHPSEGRTGELEPDACVARECLEKGRGALCVRLHAPREPDAVLGSAMVAPLADEAGAFGAVWVAASERCFGPNDLRLLGRLADLVAVALEIGRAHQAAVAQALLAGDNAIARRIQMEFLPRSLPQANGYEFFKYYKPVQAVGGDYFDFIWLPDRRLAVLVADVSGKGVPAALLMSRFSAEARYCLTAHARDLGRGVATLNVAMSEVVGERYVTLLACVLNPSTHRVEIVCCGHESPWLLRAGSARFDYVIDRDQVGDIIGLNSASSYVPIHVELKPGDQLLLFTDGVTDARDARGKTFGVGRLHDIAARLHPSNPAGLSAKALGQLVINDVLDHVGEQPQADDITLVCFGRDRADGDSDTTTNDLPPVS
jgi:sigma-B regulation protein RsbU (phosphoserine phosphatase)